MRRKGDWVVRKESGEERRGEKRQGDEKGDGVMRNESGW